MNNFLILIAGSMVMLLAGCASPAQRMMKEKDASAHYKMGLSYLNDKAYQAAFLEFQKAVDSDPGDKLSHYALGTVYVHMKKNQEALKEFEIVTKIDPDYSEAYNYAGTISESSGDLDAAEKFYKKALKNRLYQTPQFSHYHLGDVYLKRGKYQEALAEYQEAIHIDPGFVEAYRASGDIFLKVGDAAAAIASFEEAVHLSPDDPQNHFKLGEAYWNQKIYKKGEVEFNKVISLAPNSDLGKEAKKQLERRK
ncbi:MAG: tetratricopeptide repeat protein [Nitrospirae bacterium]|nr:tetratricopeptide repeat protein [Nitrospirota bacterium]MBI3604467.1 tetratricopeptide repeat protein [Nitrospirota bacterium]